MGIENQEGLRLFLENDFDITWNGFAVWYYSSGHIDCHYEAKITLNPTEGIFNHTKLKQLIDTNPFASEIEIQNLFKKSLCRFLDHKFDYYCTCDDYFEPVVEDFEIEDYLKEWCDKNCFELVSCEGDGYDNGFEPDYHDFGY